MTSGSAVGGAAGARGGPRTKLVCTIGPASRSKLDELIAAGMSVARINLAHGSMADQAETILAVRASADRLGRDVAVLVDLPGPKIRLGPLAEEELVLPVGTRWSIGPTQRGDVSGATASYPLAPDLRPGDRVLLADGAVELRVTGSSGETLETVVERAGTVRSNAGIAVPAGRRSAPVLTASDTAALPELLRLGVDLLGQSFARRSSDVTALRDAVRGIDPTEVPGIVVKIETRAAFEDADAIIRAADAVMVARGDLGVELPYEQVPLVQKSLVQAARAAGRPVIIATQMLESMTRAPRPTRAEASDVANAVFEGADAVMLSGETAIGAYPLEAAQAAIRILAAAEAYPGATAVAPIAGAPRPPDDPLAVVLAAIELARVHRDVRAIACFSHSGKTAELLAQGRPRVPIMAFSPDGAVRRRLAVHHGVRAHVVDPSAGADLRAGIARIVAEQLNLEATDALVLLTTSAGGADGPNTVELLRPIR